MASSQDRNSEQENSIGFDISANLETSFGNYFRKTKELAGNVVSYLSPHLEDTTDDKRIDLDSMTSSNESDSLTNTMIDSILSVPESDEEKCTMAVLRPSVLSPAVSVETNDPVWQKDDSGFSSPAVSVETDDPVWQKDDPGVLSPAASVDTDDPVWQKDDPDLETEYSKKVKSNRSSNVQDHIENANVQDNDGIKHIVTTDPVEPSQYNQTFGENNDNKDSKLHVETSLTEDDLDKLEQMQKTMKPYFIAQGEHVPDAKDHQQAESASGRSKSSMFFIGDNEEVRNPTLRIFMFGKTGSGKSSTANTILGTDIFQTSKSFGSVTLTGKRAKTTRFGFDLEVIDSPGLLDNRSDDSSFTENEIIRSAILSSPGFHVALFVMQYGRITMEDEMILKTFRKFFGENVLENAILVFTCVDTPEEQEALENDVNCLSTKEAIEEQTKLQQELLQSFAFRYFVIRNRGSKTEKEASAAELVGIIAKMSNNGERFYTSPIFRQLEDAFTYMVREDETKYLLDMSKLQKDFTDELAVLQVIPKIQADFLYQLIQYRTWSQQYEEKWQTWDQLLEKLRGKETVELSLEEIELLKDEQKWRDTGRQIHRNFMEAIKELQVHNQKALAPKVKTFEKQLAHLQHVYNTKCTEARERMKMEAETSLKSFLSNQGWNKLISAGLVVAAVGGGVIAFGPLLASVFGASVATKVMAAASAAYMGFMNWKK